MIAYILRRALYMIPVLLGINAITLFLFFEVSQDPILQFGGRKPTEATLRALREKHELDAPAFFSFAYLSGEDILASKRYDKLQPILEAVNEASTAGNIDTSLATNFINRWERRGRRGALDDSDHLQINTALEALTLAPEITVQFSDIELTEREEAKVGRRSIWDAHFFRILRFDFAPSMVYGETILQIMKRKGPITLSVTIPMFLIGLAVELTLALFAGRHRGTKIDTGITILAVLTMSIPFLSYIVGGQWLAAESEVLPVSGWEPGFAGLRYLIFPVTIGVIAGLGGGVRFYRAVLLEEMERDYVRTARAKGTREKDILYIHVLRNAGIPIVTRLSVIIPFLITGSLLIERCFEIPGLGELMLSSIESSDFWVVMPLTYILAVVYSVAVLATDVMYALVDPRVRVQ